MSQHRRRPRNEAQGGLQQDGFLHQARKRFGQNFLHDQAVIARIVRAINPKPEQAMVEIGPGLGALTE